MLSKCSSIPAISIEPRPPSKCLRFRFLRHALLARRLSHWPARTLFSTSRDLRDHYFLCQSRISSRELATLASMPSTYHPSVANVYPSGSIFDLGMQSSIPPASSDTQPLEFAACFRPPTVESGPWIAAMTVSLINAGADPLMPVHLSEEWKVR